MKRSVVLAMTFAFLGGIAGCGSNPTEDTVNKILTQMSEASQKVTSVRSELEKAVKKADESKKKITTADLEEAIKQAKNLRKVGEELLTLKAAVDNLKNKVDQDRREALGEKYAQQVAEAVRRLEKNTEDLDQTVERVAARVDGPQTIATLREALRDSIQEFEALSRRN